ncbi:MAG TPA: hypothetical protein VIY69_04770 [Candidatus Acidoferrales bacterium]
METAVQQPHDFAAYVAKLEGQNRRMKRMGLSLFALSFLAIGFMGWQVWRLSHPSFLKVKMISAEQINALDPNGQIQASLLGTADGANLFLIGNGKTALTFLPGDAAHPGSTLTLSSPDEKQQVMLLASDPYASMSLGGNDDGSNKIEAVVGPDWQHLRIADRSGYQAVLGTASLVKAADGETRNTSAAALTLFRKDGHIIWMTPTP